MDFSNASDFFSFCWTPKIVSICIYVSLNWFNCMFQIKLACFKMASQWHIENIISLHKQCNHDLYIHFSFFCLYIFFLSNRWSFFFIFTKKTQDISYAVHSTRTKKKIWRNILCTQAVKTFQFHIHNNFEDMCACTLYIVHYVRF